MLKTGTLFAMVCALIAQFGAAAYADVAPDPFAGGTSMINSSQTTNVSMNSEVVTIKLTKDKCHVHVVFDMRNTGPAEELEVGFPCNYNEEMNNFSAVVDGRPVRTKTEEGGRYRKEWCTPVSPAIVPGGHPLPPEPKPAYTTPRPYQELGYGAWKTWKMYFGDHARRTIEISYENILHPLTMSERMRPRTRAFYPDGRPADEDPPLPTAAEVHYVLRTGAFWKGPIGKATVNVICDGIPTTSLLEAYPIGWHLTGKGATLVKTNFEPDEDVKIFLDAKVKNTQQGEQVMVSRKPDYASGLLYANQMLSFYALHSDPTQALSYADSTVTERIKQLKKGQLSVDFGDIDFAERLVGFYSNTTTYPRFKTLAPKLVELLSFKLEEYYKERTYTDRIKRIKDVCKRISQPTVMESRKRSAT